MFDAFRFKCPPQELNAAIIKQLRGLLDLGIEEIKARAEQHLALLEYPVFSNDWQDNKKIIKKLLDRMNADQLPLEVYRYTVFDDDSVLEEQLTLQDAYEALAELRRIELEQDMLSQFDAGHISSRDEYVPDNEDD